MPRRVEDIIPGGNRSIRNVRLDKNDSAKDKEKVVEEETVTTVKTYEKKVPLKKIKEPEVYEDDEVVEVIPKNERRKTKSGKGLKIFLTLGGVVVVLIVVAYFASTYFSRAIFTIKPKEVPVTVNSTLISNAVSTNGSIAYELVSIHDAASTTVKATVGGHTETKAKGIVTLYNTFTNTPWRLIAGTRLQDEDGKIYKLTGTVSIPGYTKSASGALIPGAIVTPIVADTAGDEYNVSLTDPLTKLHIVAYKGNSKYESIYAKITSPITGGFKGNKVTVNPQLLASTSATLQEAIAKNSFSKLKTSVPEGYILYDAARTSVFNPAEVENSEDDKATVSVQGTVYGIMFKKSDLVNRIAGQAVVQSFNGLDYDSPGLEELAFSISNLKDFSPVKKNTLIVKIKGDMKLVGAVPIDTLKSDFAGKSLADTESILRNYSPIIDLNKSSGQVVPPWSKIPNDKERITINIQK